jgi:hypothetical protein
VKLLDFMDPSETGPGLALSPQVVVFPQNLLAGTADFALSIPSGTFLQRRQGLYGVSYSATLSDGAPLPSWLAFSSGQIALTATFVTLDGWRDISNVTNAAGAWTAAMDVHINAIDAIGGTVRLAALFSDNCIFIN